MFLKTFLLRQWTFVVLFVMGIIGIFARKNFQRTKEERDLLEQQLKDATDAKEVEDWVNDLHDDDVVGRLRREGWIRD